MKHLLDRIETFINKQYELNPFRARLVEGICAILLTVVILALMILALVLFTPL